MKTRQSVGAGGIAVIDGPGSAMSSTAVHEPKRSRDDESSTDRHERFSFEPSEPDESANGKPVDVEDEDGEEDAEEFDEYNEYEDYDEYEDSYASDATEGQEEMDEQRAAGWFPMRKSSLRRPNSTRPRVSHVPPPPRVPSAVLSKPQDPDSSRDAQTTPEPEPDSAVRPKLSQASDMPSPPPALSSTDSDSDETSFPELESSSEARSTTPRPHTASFVGTSSDDTPKPQQLDLPSAPTSPSMNDFNFETIPSENRLSDVPSSPTSPASPSTSIFSSVKNTGSETQSSEFGGPETQLSENQDFSKAFESESQPLEQATQPASPTRILSPAKSASSNDPSDTTPLPTPPLSATSPIMKPAPAEDQQRSMPPLPPIPTNRTSKSLKGATTEEQQAQIPPVPPMPSNEILKPFRYNSAQLLQSDIPPVPPLPPSSSSMTTILKPPEPQASPGLPEYAEPTKAFVVANRSKSLKIQPARYRGRKSTASSTASPTSSVASPQLGNDAASETSSIKSSPIDRPSSARARAASDGASLVRPPIRAAVSIPDLSTTKDFHRATAPAAEAEPKTEAPAAEPAAPAPPVPGTIEAIRASVRSVLTSTSSVADASSTGRSSSYTYRSSTSEVPAKSENWPVLEEGTTILEEMPVIQMPVEGMIAEQSPVKEMPRKETLAEQMTIDEVIDEGMTVEDAIMMYMDGFDSDDNSKRIRRSQLPRRMDSHAARAPPKVEIQTRAPPTPPKPEIIIPPTPPRTEIPILFSPEDDGMETSAASEAPSSFLSPPTPDLSSLAPPKQFSHRRTSTQMFAGEFGMSESPQRSPTSSNSPSQGQADALRALTQPVNSSSNTRGRDRYGFKTESQWITAEEYALWDRGYTFFLQNRKKKWVHFMNHYGLKSRNPTEFPPRSDKLKRYIRKGFPPEWRGTAWFYYGGGHEALAKNPGLYARLVQRADDGEIKESDREHIERDLHRTFPDNIRFKNEEATPVSSPTAASPVSPSSGNDPPETPMIKSLRRVLRAFAIHNSRIGYCQSLNFLAGTLLLFLDGDEEKSFHLLNVLTNVHLPGTHGIALEGANVDIGVLMSALKESLPAVWAKLDDRADSTRAVAASDMRVAAGLPTVSLATTAWFMSAFVSTLPIETAVRAWDVLFYEGSKTLFRIALAIFKLGEREIREKTDPMEVFQVVQTLPRRLIDANAVLDVAMRKGKQGIGSVSQEVVETRREERRELYKKEAERIFRIPPPPPPPPPDADEYNERALEGGANKLARSESRGGKLRRMVSLKRSATTAASSSSATGDGSKDKEPLQDKTLSRSSSRARVKRMVSKKVGLDTESKKVGAK